MDEQPASYSIADFAAAAFSVGVSFTVGISALTVGAAALDRGIRNLPPIPSLWNCAIFSIVLFAIGAVVGVLEYAAKVLRTSEKVISLPRIVRILGRAEIVYKTGVWGLFTGAIVALAWFEILRQNSTGMRIAETFAWLVQSKGWLAEGRTESVLTGAIYGGAIGALFGVVLLVCGIIRVQTASPLLNAEQSHAPEPAAGPDSNAESSPPAR